MNNDKIYFSITQSSFDRVDKDRIDNFQVRVIYNKDDKYRNVVLHLLKCYYIEYHSLNVSTFRNFIYLNEYEPLFSYSLKDIYEIFYILITKNPKEFLKMYKEHTEFATNKIKSYFSNKRSIKSLHDYKCIQDLERKCYKIYSFLTNIETKKIKRIIKFINDKTTNYDENYMSELLNIFDNIQDYINISIDVIINSNIKYEKGKDLTSLIKNFNNYKTIRRNKYYHSSKISLFFKLNHNSVKDISIIQYILGTSNALKGNYNILFDIQLFDNNLYLYVEINENVEDFYKYIRDCYNNHLDNLLMIFSKDYLKFTEGTLDEIYYNLYKRLSIINNDYNYRQYLYQYKYADIKEILDNIFNNLDEIVSIEVSSSKKDFNKFIDNNKELLKDFKIKE